MSDLPDNYRWWQDSATDWKQVVAERKRHMPIYHLQEMVLTDLLGRSAPARALEFGCGFGRHLEYVRRIPGVEVHGYEQSQTMLDQLDWADPDWTRERLRVGRPLEPLPYEDGAFDVVYTVSVLIHVRPEDLGAILAELVRVSRWQVVHFENLATDQTHETSPAHDGCWAHDIEGAYRSLDRRAAVLPRCFELQDVYRVHVDEARPAPDLGPDFAARCLALDQDLSQELQRLRAVEERAERREQALETRIDELRQAGEEIQDKLEAALDRTRDAERRREAAETERGQAITRAVEAGTALAAALERARDAEDLRKQAETARAEASALATRAGDQLAGAQVRAREAEARCESAEATRLEAVEKSRELGASLETARQEATAAEKRYQQARDALERAQQELGARSAEIRQIENRLRRAMRL